MQDYQLDLSQHSPFACAVLSKKAVLNLKKLPARGWGAWLSASRLDDENDIADSRSIYIYIYIFFFKMTDRFAR